MEKKNKKNTVPIVQVRYLLVCTVRKSFSCHARHAMPCEEEEEDGDNKEDEDGNCQYILRYGTGTGMVVYSTQVR